MSQASHWLSPFLSFWRPCWKLKTSQARPFPCEAHGNAVFALEGLALPNPGKQDLRKETSPSHPLQKTESGLYHEVSLS